MSHRSDQGNNPHDHSPDDFSLLGEGEQGQHGYREETFSEGGFQEGPEDEMADPGGFDSGAYDASADAAAEVAEWIDGDPDPGGAFAEDGTDGAADEPLPDAPPTEMSEDQAQGGIPWLVIGLVVLGVGAAVPFVGEPLTNALGEIGSAGTGLICTGLALLAIGAVGRSLGTSRNRLTNVEAGLCENRDTTNRIASLVDYLVNLQQSSVERRPASGEELDQVLLLLQRQDEKTNNLTRAFKMFGKPLIEVTNNTNDAAQALQTLQDMVSGLQSETATQKTTLGESVERMETTLRGTTEILKTNHQEQVEAFEGLETRLDEAQTDGTQAGAGLEAKIEALQTTLEGLKESLQGSQPDAEALKTQLGQAVQEPLGQLSQTLEANTNRLTAELTAELEKLSNGNQGEGHLDTAFQKLHRELSGLGTTLANIQASIHKGAAAPVAATATANAPAATPAGTGPATATQTATPAQTKAQGALGGNKPETTTDYASGERPASKKNVLGAIAKLKQMRE